MNQGGNKDALLKSYSTRLRDDVKSMLENFEETVKLAKGENETQLSKLTQCEQGNVHCRFYDPPDLTHDVFSDTYEMQVRAANIVRAGESLMKLVSDIKQFLVLNDFHSVNDAISSSSNLYRSTQQDRDAKLMSLRDEMASDLYDHELEYYVNLCDLENSVKKN